MHELALSQNIINTAISAAGRDGTLIRTINVEAGVLSGVNPDSLRFWMERMLKQKDMPEARVEIHRRPAECRCECGVVYQTSDMFRGCPDCGGFSREVMEGLEVKVKSVEIEDDSDEQS